MSGIKYDDFTNPSMKKLYEVMWQNNPLVSKMTGIEKSPATQNNTSNNSYCFSGKADKAELLIDIFDISNKDLFREKFKMACGGSGQEYRRITTLHSSSLCALLFFYNITDENPLEIEIAGKPYCFTESVFEFKSPAINSPSNMDIVLLGTEKVSGKSVVLFLESKFSEYYSAFTNHLERISDGYLDNPYSESFYKGVFWKYLDTEVLPEKDGFVQLRSTKKYYIGGIKQMISHYVGIRNIMDGNFYSGKKEPSQLAVENAIMQGADILLAEILYDGKLGRMKNEYGQAYLDSYEEMYVKFADKAMTEIDMAGLGKHFRVSMKDLGYSLFLNNDHLVEKRILDFYFEG